MVGWEPGVENTGIMKGKDERELADGGPYTGGKEKGIRQKKWSKITANYRDAGEAKKEQAMKGHNLRVGQELCEFF